MGRLSFPTVKLRGHDVPRVMLGTSPFIAAGQFGRRAYEYYVRFVLNPANIVKIMEYCLNMGVAGIQALAYDFIIESILEAARSTGVKPIVIGTVDPEDPRGSLDLLDRVEAIAALIHGSITSSKMYGEIERELKLIKDHGMIPGVALHRIDVLNELLDRFPDIEVVMAPVNYAGYMMGDRENSLKILGSCGRFIIAKKVLAAGKLDVRRALKYVFSIPYIKSVAVGVSSEREAEETFNTAYKVLIGQKPS